MIGKIFKGIGKAFKAATGVLNMVKNFMNSPLGGLLKLVFPQSSMLMGGLSFLGMFNNLSGGIGGGHNY